jgi:nucleolar complex protein 2
MGKKAPKASRKLAVKGELKRQIQERHKHQKVKKRLDGRKVQKGTKAKENGKGKEKEAVLDEEDDDDEEIDQEGEKYAHPFVSRMKCTKIGQRFKGMSVDDFLGAGFMDAEDESVRSPRVLPLRGKLMVRAESCIAVG